MAPSNAATWIVEPRDPLIVRDGRPFGADPGARAASLPFPFPSTTTGAVRSLDGISTHGSFKADDKAEIARVKAISVKGPLLVSLDHEGEITAWFGPAPADALLIETEPAQTGVVVRKKLVPLVAPDGSSRDLAGFDIVGQVASSPQKPYAGAPRFWRWSELQNWLANTSGGKVTSLVASANLGVGGAVAETRTHLKIDPGTQTSDEGFLFQTRGLEFTVAGRSPQLGRGRLALAVETPANLHDSVSSLGGERRVVLWRKSTTAFPACPESIREQIVATGACRMLLLTPGVFANGWLPAVNDGPLMRAGIEPTVRAAAVSRYQVISGWDYELRKPKRTRRVVPAGSVFFLKLQGEASVSARRDWVQSLWFACVSDDQQDQLDGFGLAALGTWSGEPEAMEVQ